MAAVVLVVVGLVLGWATSTLFRPPPPLPQGAAYSVVAVREGELSRSVTLNAAAAWRGGDQLVNQAAGVLTQRLVPGGEEVSSGDVVYTVDLAPVVVAVGDVPAFRDLVPGSRGEDVRQLQQMLVATGHRSAVPDGRFDSATVGEYREWQRASGIPVTGTAPLGSLVFVSRLPAVVGWNDAATAVDGEFSTDAQGVVGTRLTEGDAVAQLLPPVPSFAIDLPTGQRRLVDPGMSVSLSLGQHTWNAVVESVAAPRDDGSAMATLAAVGDEESICGEECGAIPIAGEGSIRATITVLAPKSGPIVPTAALAVAADGSTAVVDREGETIPVTVLATVGGQALVEGVAAGTEVRAPGEVSGGRVTDDDSEPGGSAPGTPAPTETESGDGGSNG